MVRDIEDVVHALRNARENETGATLLVGAGCSVKAGIPLAGGFVEKIRDKYPRDYARAGEKTYACCMRELEPGRRRDLIAAFVREAKINWAHVCIAALMKEGYVDRVLTTNFDNLVVRACALLGEFPAVYDLAGLSTIKPADVPKKAVFHLHGQHTGFFLLNTEEEMEKQFEVLGPVFEESGRRRTWIVAGYSGNDPVFKHLAAVSQFDFGCYWIGYQDSPPAEHVREGLLRADRFAFHVGGFDADSFFVTVCQKLGVFPPQFVGDPFGFLQGVLETLTPYTLPGESVEKDVTRDARERIRQAAESEGAGARAAGEASADASGPRLHSRMLTEFMAGSYDRVVELAGREGEALPEEAADLLAWSHIKIGNRHLERARSERGEEADRSTEQAIESYRQALRIRPDRFEALGNWGAALSEAGQRRGGGEADRLYAEAISRYEQALRISPDDHEVLTNWGNVLSYLARGRAGAEADRLYEEAAEKYEAALRVRPDSANVFYNQAIALSFRAGGKQGPEADRLYAEAAARFADAVRASPDHFDALRTWGRTLVFQSESRSGAERTRLEEEAAAKFRDALRIKPTDTGALGLLAVLLCSLGAGRDPAERAALTAEAETLLLRAEAVREGAGAYNLACLFARQGDAAQARRWLERSRELGVLPDRAHLLGDPDLERVREEPWFQDLLAGAAG